MAEKKTAETKTPTFEEAMARLEDIVKQLERGEVQIEKSLELFEEGTRLMKECCAILDEAEQKVRKLTKAAEQPETTPFDAE